MLRKDKELLERIAAKDINQDAGKSLVGPRIWAMSDIHTDKKENMQGVLDLDPQEFHGSREGSAAICKVTCWGEHVCLIGQEAPSNGLLRESPAGGFNHFAESFLVPKNDPQ